MVDRITCCFIIILISMDMCRGQTLTESESAVIKPGNNHKLTCTFSGIEVGNADISWIRQAEGKGLEWISHISAPNGSGKYYSKTVEGRFTISRDNSKMQVYLHMTNLQSEDTGVYYCARSVDGAFDYWGKGTAVTVTSAQDSPPKSIFAMSQCSADPDGFLAVGCLTRGFSPADSITFNWKDSNDKKLTDFVQYPALGSGGDYTKISHLRVKKSDWDSQKPYTCEASNSKGSLDTKVAPPAPAPELPAAIYLTVPTQTELENGNATFMCLAQKFSPKTYSFKWFQDGQEVESVIGNYNTSEKSGTVTLYSATSILQIPAQNWQKQDTKIKCEFQTGKMEKQSSEAKYTATQQDCSNVAGEIIPPSLEDMLRNRRGVLKCKTSGLAGFTKIEIKANNKVISNTSNIMPRAEKVELDAIIGYEEWSNGTVFACIVEHSCLAHPEVFTFRRENGEGHTRPSVYLLAPPEQKANETMTLTCYVKDFYPKEVFVSWLADDESKNLKYKPKTSQPMQNDKYFSVYSQITVDDTDWKSGTVFSCVVYHESIDEQLRVLTRSIADNKNKSSVINLSMNTPCCKE